MFKNLYCSNTGLENNGGFAPLPRILGGYSPPSPPGSYAYAQLTIIADCMGVNTHIAINQMWKEQAILWFIIAANKGQKKTAPLRLLKKPLQEIEEKEAEKWFTNHGN